MLMKKLYASIFAACAAMAATAATPSMKMAEGTLTATNSVPEIEKRFTSHTERMVIEQDASKALKAPAKAHENDSWEALGEGTFYEGIVGPLFGLSAQSYKVAVEKSTTTEGLYRVLEPYKDVVAGTGTLFDYNSANAQPMYLQVVGDNQFYVEGFDTGLSANHSQVSGEVVIKSNTQSLVDANGVDACLQAIPDAFGKMKDGVFSFSSPTFALNGNTYYSLLVNFGSGTQNYAGNANGEFKLVLPGATVKDYSINMDYECCHDDKFTFQFSLGSDVENYKITIIAGEYSKSESNFAVVAKNGQNFTKSQRAISFTPAANAAEGIYTVFAVSLDADGNYVEGVRGLFFVQRDNNDKWTTLEGKALYTDDFVASIYRNHDDVEHEVTIQESNETPGYYRLVNAYAAPYKYASQISLSCTHSHYLYINATNPDQVYIEESAIGFDYGDGSMTVCSTGFRMTKLGQTPEAADWGKLENNTITFPEKGLLARELKYNDGGWYYANTNSAFKVKLPEKEGVSSIVADSDLNAPVEYFNLQGQRIDNPVSGQLVVKRQGKNVQKLIVR